MYIFGRFDEVSAIRKPKIITSSITSSQIFFADFVFSTKTKRNTAYRKTVNNTNKRLLVTGWKQSQLTHEDLISGIFKVFLGHYFGSV